MIKLRKFSFSDLDQVMEIEKVSFPNREAYPKFLFERYNQEYPEGFIVAENEKEIIGYTIGLPKNNNSGEIISLAVNPNWHQKGVGTALTNFLINHFKERNIKGVLLNVRTKNKIGISFYQHLGFKILQTIKNYYQNGDDAYLMQKEIRLGG